MSEPATAPAARFTLRQLPLPAKLVVTCFLLAVGLGYTAAMIQLHVQDSKSGKPMPTVEDVIVKFTGKRWYTSAPPRPVSKLEMLIMGPIDGQFGGNTSMAAAFFHKDAADYRELTKNAPPAVKAKIDAEREGERLALQLWINTPEEERRSAYETDRLIVPADKAPKAITADFAHNPGKIGDGLKVKSILTTRCVRCHAKDGDEPKYTLESYPELVRYMEVEAAVEVPPGGGYVKVEQPMSMEKLTQSTHAHLLSFAMLFSLTGLVFAFTSYPGVVRCALAPLALVAVVTDVGLWWAARFSEHGEYFAMGVICTGGVVGLALGAQIVLSLFNLYAWKGKAVLLVLFGLAAAGGGALYVNRVEQALKEKQERVQAANDAPAKPKQPDAAQPPVKADVPPPKKDDQKVDMPPVVVPMSPAAPSRLEVLLTGTFDPKKKGSFGGKGNGGMIRAFFDKEDTFAAALEDQSDELPRLIKEREGEQAAVLAWVKSPPDARKKAYEENKFTLPEGWNGRPMTPEFKTDDKTVKVKTLLDTRCAVCHGPDGDQPDFPLHTFEGIEKYLVPAKAE